MDDLLVNDDDSLDRMVADLSEEMIDDYPASDPRWAESVQNGNCTSTIMSCLPTQSISFE